MNAKSAVVGLSLGLLVFAVSARAQSAPSPTAADIRREITELKELLQEATLRLEALERRLEHTGQDRDVQFQDWRIQEGQDSYLRFPIDVERAMMAPPNFRQYGLEQLDFQTPVPPAVGQGTLPGADIRPEPHTLRLL